MYDQEAAMVANHVHDALRQVRELQRLVWDSQRFTGYSGRSRAVGGTLALAAAIIMSRAQLPTSAQAHLAGWAVVAAVAVIANYSGLLHWFMFHPKAARDVRRLMPTVDALPPLAVGALLSLVLVRHQLHDLLPGVWMCLYGLANLSSRRVLPAAIWPLGLFYVSSGAICLLAVDIPFTNPWPMGLVFGAGEWAGGLIFHRCRMPEATVTSFFMKGDQP
jgi:hypothetical protein